MEKKMVNFKHLNETLIFKQPNMNDRESGCKALIEILLYFNTMIQITAPVAFSANENAL